MTRSYTSPASSENCLFPVSKVTAGGRQEWRTKELAQDLLHEAVMFCGKNDIDLIAFVTTVWATVIQGYSDVRDVHIGQERRTRRFGPERECQLGWKQNMTLVSTTITDGVSVRGLLQPGKWKASPVDPDKYHTFNTGVVVWEGEPLPDGRRFNGKGSEDGMDDETCSVVIIVHLRPGTQQWFLAHRLPMIPERQADHISTFVMQAASTILKGWEVEVQNVSLISEEQLLQVQKWNAPTLVQSKLGFLHEIISHRVCQHPSQQAIDAWDGTLSYSELDDASNQLCWELIALGVRPGHLVPVCFEKSVWAIVAMLAINKAGAAFVPLDAAQPRARLQAMAKRLRTPVGLVGANVADILGDSVPLAVEISEKTHSMQPRGRGRPPVAGDPLTPAYCLFTSGSTGVPKGCLVSHAALASVAAHTGPLHLEPSSRVLQFASFTFGVSLIEIWCTLTAGGTLCIPSQLDRVNHLADVVGTMGVNWAILTPTTLDTLQPDQVSGLQRIVVAGEPLRRSQIIRWMHRVYLHQGYGFTEWAGIYAVSRRIQSTTDVGLVGKPVFGPAWLADTRNPNQLAPIGAVGELVVEGSSLATGYYEDTTHTAAKFFQGPSWLPSPSSPNSRTFYSTGDLARYDCDGSLRFIGRKDRQVKIRGHRVEVAEIESHLGELCPRYTNSVVDGIVPADADGNRVLVVFFPSENALPSAAGLSNEDDDLLVPMDEAEKAKVHQAVSALQKQLPDYMVPRTFIGISRMPLTRTGKVDRTKLRLTAERLSPGEWNRLAGLTTNYCQPPATKSEHLIHQLVVKILKRPSDLVGMQYSFQSHGGDSIMAMKMVGLARRQNIRLSVQDVLSLSLEELAAQADGYTRDSQADALPPRFSLLCSSASERLIPLAADQCRVEPSEIDDIYPCTPLQEGMMSLANGQPGGYVARFVYQLSRSVNLNRLASAWNATVAANPVLRTRIISGEDRQLYQVVVRHGTSLQLQESEPETTMSLGDALVRFSWRKDSADIINLILTIHHVVCDRWSSEIIRNQLESAYNGRQLALNHFTPFIKYTCQIVPVEAKEYWATELAGWAGQQFPTLSSEGYVPRPVESMERLISHQDRLPDGYTVSNILRLAWALVVSHYTGLDDVVFGVTVTGRSAPVNNVEEINGPTIATVPVRVKLHDRHTIAELLDQVQTQSTAMIPFEQTGLQHIRQYSEDCMRACGFQSHITVQPAWQANTGSNNATVLSLRSAGPAIPRGFSSYALNVICQCTDVGEIRVSVDFDPSAVPSFVMEHILSHFEYMLQWILAHPMSSLKEIPRVSPLDMTRLRQWNGPTPLCVNECIHDVIQKHVERSPGASAIRGWDGEFSYAELGQITDRLAHVLVREGVEQKTIVPLCFEKSAWTTVAMLAVLKAGGAFLLLDSSQPLQRLQQICKRASSRLVLTSEEKHTMGEQLAPRAMVVSRDHCDRYAVDGGCKSLARMAHPNNPAYVVFTSGSTGTPKGVIVPHRSYCTGAAAHNATFQINSRSRVLQTASYAFDISVLETLSTLIAGGCVLTPSEWQKQNALVETAVRMQPTHMYLTPSVARFALAQNADDLQITQTFISVGEPLTASDVKQWASRPWKFMNGYGPAECCPISTVQDSFEPRSDPRKIGVPQGARCWLIDPNDHHRLVPVGAAGEILIEGPIVGQGYLNDPERTAASFVYNPSWLQEFDATGDRSSLPLYRTGDLARYAADGSLLILGRKDTQVKLHGQRLELGEVEGQLRGCFPGVLDVVAELVVSQGRPCLVAFILMSGTPPVPLDDLEDQILGVPTPDFQARGTVARSKLEQVLPSFMVPNFILPLCQLPRTASGKTDRRRLRELPSQIFWHRCISFYRPKGERRMPEHPVERKLQKLWAHVLNRRPESIAADDTFYELGGDSITAMQVVAQARSQGLGTSVNDILRLKTLSRVALHCHTATALKGTDASTEREVAFPLSPIQQMFFESQWQDLNHYCQRFVMGLKAPIELSLLETIVGDLMRRHPMLQARFVKQSDGSWQQIISSSHVSRSICETHTVADTASRDTIIARIARNIDIRTGPVLRVGLLNVRETGTQHLCIVAHHLVVDFVSWRIILGDIEIGLRRRKIPESSSWSFSQWVKVQKEYSEQHLAPDVAVPVPLPDSYRQDHCRYWGITQETNLVKDSVSQIFEVDAATTESLLGPANRPFNTQPLDLLLSTLLYSWGRAFPERQLPLIFNEGHGREPWSREMDLSQTVGWFTTLSPLLVTALDAQDDFPTIVRAVKDARASLPANGWAYFTSRFEHPQGRVALQQSHPIEIIFNYAGLYQQLERDDGMFFSEGSTNQGMLDAGGQIARMAIFEVVASVVQGRLQIQVLYNRNTKYQDAIIDWMVEYQKAFTTATQTLKGRQRQYTLADFPLLSLTYEQLDEMMFNILPHKCISWEDVEDIYPCSPVQDGMLIAQAKEDSHYQVKVSWIVESRASVPVCVERLKSAWEGVVAYHAALRTVFIPSVTEDTYMNQLVLKAGWSRAPCQTRPSVSPDRADGGENPGVSLCHVFTVDEDEGNRVTCVLNINHAIMDDHSLGIIKQDLCLAYDGHLPAGPETPYRNYIAHVKSQDPKAATTYWRSYMAEVEPCHFPPLQNVQTSQSEDTWGVSTLRFTEMAALRQFCQTYSVTPWNVLCLAWAMVLRAFTHSDQVCFGYAQAGRDLPIERIQATVGPIINMLPCRCNFDQKSTVEAAIHNLQKEYLDALLHQSVPLSSIHRLANSQSSLFNTSLAITSEGETPASDTCTTLSLTKIHIEDNTEYDMVASLDMGPEDVKLGLRYKAALMKGEQALSVISTLEKAITQIVAKPSILVSELDVLSEHDRQAIWRTNNEVPADSNVCVHDIIKEQCRRQPDAVAVQAWDGRFTYEQLNILASSLTRVLQRRGVGREVIVPLYFERSCWTAVAILGVLKAGGAFLLLDPAHPSEYLEKMCHKVSCKVIVASPTYAKVSRRLCPDVVVLSRDGPLGQEGKLPVKASGITPALPNSPVYVVFTSGSTGEPKGIIIEHHSYVSGARAHMPAYNINSATRMLQFSSYAFDTSILEHLSVLMAGGCICIPSETDRMNGLVKAIRELDVNHAMLVPSLARRLDKKDLAGVRTLALVGESMTATDVAQWASALRLVNGYGPAECSVASVIQPRVTTQIGPRNIGFVRGCVAWVVNQDDPNRLVPVGAIGELVIEGPIVGRGYINDAVKTRAVFIDPPGWLKSLRLNPCGKLYKTGDLVRRKVDGSLEYISRRDSQVKLRGQRIELADVETHVRQAFEGAEDAVAELVDMFGGRRTKTQLVVLVVASSVGCVKRQNGEDRDNTDCLLQAPSDGFCVHAAAVTSILQQRLPRYMVPSIMLPLVEVPRTTSGKVDRKRLRAVLQGLSAEDVDRYRALSTPASSRASMTEAEKALLSLWGTVLGVGVESLSVQDNFFHSGGDSIDAMKLAAMSRATPYAVSVGDIFARPMLSDLATVTAPVVPSANAKPYRPFSMVPSSINVQTLAEDYRERYPALQQAVVLDVLPASDVQRFFIRRNTFHSYHFNLKGNVDVARLQRACSTITKRYGILRTAFREHEGRLLQTVLAQVDQANFRHVCTDKDHMTVYKSLWEADISTLDAYGDLMVSFTLVSKPPLDHVLALQISHAQWDGVSIPHLFRELAAVYNNEQLQPLQSDYAQYLYQCATQDRAGPLAFWTKYLHGSSVTTPFTPSHPTGEGPSTTVWGVTALAIPAVPPGITMATLVKAACAFYIANMLSLTEVVFGQTVNGRHMSLEGVDTILGPCLNFIPIRVQLPPGGRVQDLLHRVHNEHVETMPYDSISAAEIIEKCTTWPADSDLRFIVQHQNIQLHQDMPLHGVEVKDSMFANFQPLDEVWVFSVPYPDRLEIEVCADSSVLSREQAEFFSKQIATVVELFWRSGNDDLETVAGRLGDPAGVLSSFRV